jgi:hypothetical protein
MPDYTSLVAQARRVRELALQTAEEVEARNRGRYAAYLWLAHEPQGQALLDDWCLLLTTGLLQPGVTGEDLGEMRFVQKILKVIREDAPQALSEETV